MGATGHQIQLRCVANTATSISNCGIVPIITASARLLVCSGRFRLGSVFAMATFRIFYEIGVKEMKNACQHTNITRVNKTFLLHARKAAAQNAAAVKASMFYRKQPDSANGDGLLMLSMLL